MEGVGVGWSKAVWKEAGLKQRSLSRAEGVGIVSVVWYHYRIALGQFCRQFSKLVFLFLNFFLGLFYLYECFCLPIYKCTMYVWCS